MNIEEHPTVKLIHERHRSQPQPITPLKLSSEALRRICLDRGADDVGFVEIERRELDEQRGDILRMFPWSKTLISLVGRINRENLRSPARSVASLELQQAGRRLSDTAYKLTSKLERMGVRAVTPAVAFPMEMDQCQARCTLCLTSQLRLRPASERWAYTETSSILCSAALPCWTQC